MVNNSSEKYLDKHWHSGSFWDGAWLSVGHDVKLDIFTLVCSSDRVRVIVVYQLVSVTLFDTKRCTSHMLIAGYGKSPHPTPFVFPPTPVLFNMSTKVVYFI